MIISLFRQRKVVVGSNPTDRNKMTTMWIHPSARKILIMFLTAIVYLRMMIFNIRCRQK